MSHFKAQSQVLGIVLDRVADHRARDAEILIHYAGALCIEFINRQEIFRVCAVEVQIKKTTAQNEHAADDKFIDSHVYLRCQLSGKKNVRNAHLFYMERLMGTEKRDGIMEWIDVSRLLGGDIEDCPADFC